MGVGSLVVEDEAEVVELRQRELRERKALEDDPLELGPRRG